MDQALLVATVHCPVCDHSSEAPMPTDACLYFYECPACQVVLKPRGLLRVLFLRQLAVPSERHFAFLTDRTHLRLPVLRLEGSGKLRHLSE